ncbi:MAG: hypothetical protein AAFW75_29475 [Cyanobacteria bacterium J06636_16]
MANKRLNTKNTKAEILAAYNEIANEKKALEMQLVATQTTASQPLNRQNGKSATPIMNTQVPEKMN